MIARHELQRMKDELDERRREVTIHERAARIYQDGLAYPALNDECTRLKAACAELEKMNAELKLECERLSTRPMPSVPAQADSEEVSLLQEQIVQLKEIIASNDVYVPPGFTKSEQVILRMLATRHSASKESLFRMLYNEVAADDLPDITIIDVFVHKVKRKLKPFGINIETLWGQGYKMPQEDKNKLKQLADEPRLEAAE